MWRSFFLAALLSGCTAGPARVRGPGPTPKIEQFPNADISFNVSGTQNEVLQNIVAFLSDNAMFHRVEIRSPQMFVVTAFFDEPAAQGARRLRKTAYRFSVGTAGGTPECAPLAITWLTESKGIREETWSAQPEDADVKPDSWPGIRDMLEKHRCPR